MASTYDFSIQKGADIALAFPAILDANGSPVDLTDYWAILQCRQRPYERSPLFFQASTFDSRLLLSNPTAGVISLILANSLTSTFKWLRGFYDLDCISSDFKQSYFISGEISIIQRVTVQ